MFFLKPAEFCDIVFQILAKGFRIRMPYVSDTTASHLFYALTKVWGKNLLDLGLELRKLRILIVGVRVRYLMKTEPD